MDESEFNHCVDDLLTTIEDSVEESGADIDFETAGGILTLFFADGSQLIINRQTALRQIWIATKSGGFHFNYDADNRSWRNEQDNEELFLALSRYCSAHTGETLTLTP